MLHDCEFADCDLPDDVYVDGVGQIDNLGINFRTIYYAFRRGPGGIFTRIPRLCVVRPKDSIGQSSMARQAWAQQLDPHTLTTSLLNS